MQAIGLKQWIKEVNNLQAQQHEGLRVRTTDDDDMYTIYAYLLGPECTPYEGGCFKVRMTIQGTEYPAQPPKCTFETKTFHPNLHPTTGEICVNTLKKDWSSTTSVLQILMTIRSLLISPNAESALNEEAGMMLLEDFEEYSRRARVLCLVHCRQAQAEYDQLSTQKAENLSKPKEQNWEGKPQPTPQITQENKLKRPQYLGTQPSKKSLKKRL